MSLQKKVESVLFELLPFGATTLPHGLMLAVHIFNSVAVGRLAGNLVATTAQFRKVAGARGSGVVMLAGSALFAVYPFGAQPVPHFAAATHPLVTGLVLSGALAINRFIQTRRQRWLGLALLCAALAPFTHEAGIMAGLVLVLIWFTREGVQLLLRPYRPMMFLAVNV
ncbi:MAG: hypothetical protein NZM11_13320, partial [Anaerolineales bacterium]|nr:hypothetical protein [Anaerolineales bacterium]